MHDGKTIINEYLHGRQAARDGKAAPADASQHFLDGYHATKRDAAVSHAGWDYKNGWISADALVDVVKGAPYPVGS